MNIIITLPTKLATLIYEGKKTIEVRKSSPLCFDPRNDVVYICEKGTGIVTGMFSIEKFTISDRPSYIWSLYHKNICIEKQWWDNYTKYTNVLCLWHIKFTEQFQKQYPLEQYFGVKKAPQSYVYTDAEWFLNDSFMVEIETSKEKAVQ